MFRRTFSFCFYYLFVSGLLAQTKDSTNTLQDIYVTATRRPVKWLMLPYASNKLLAKEKYALQLRTMPEALMGQVGVFVQKTNHGGGSPFIRGFTGNQNLLLFDGVRLNNSTYRYGPNQYFNTIDIFAIEAIEVARGTGSVQYGSDAIGGVVQVFSKQLPFTEKTKGYGKAFTRWVSSGAETTFRGEAGVSQSAFSFQVGITQRNFGDLPGGDTTGIQTPSGYKEHNYDMVLKWKITPQLLLTAFHQQVQQKDIPLYHRVKLENFAYYTFSPQERQITYLKAAYTTTKKLLQKINFVASFQQNKEQRNYQRKGNSNAFIERDKVNTVGITADIFSAFSVVHTANSGIEWYGDKVNSSRLQTNTGTGIAQLQRGLYPNDASMQQFSIYTLHHITIKSWQVEAGLRYNSNRILIQDTSTNNTSSLGIVKLNPSSLVTNLALLKQLRNNQSIYFSFSTGFRSPNIDDMGTLGLVDFRYELPAYQLKPEKSYNTELGYRLQYLQHKFHFSLFYMHLANLINRVQVAGQQINGYNVYIKENNQESFVRGAELDASFHFKKGWQLKTNAAYVYGQNTTRMEPMRRIPPAFGRLLVMKEWGTCSVYLDQQFAGAQHRLAQGDKDDNRIPVGGTPGWHTANLMFQYQRKNISLQAGCINLLNADYRMHGSGINNQGRTVTVSLALSVK